ncbi:helix-turn-helix domain-containing protein [Bacillaceae bacterium C204]|uniref:helix-turn-helix domain-containing protein n=1 Tax=Neobacillus sp. 204 TaxID=3383351 RepID=UPI00397DEB97
MLNVTLDENELKKLYLEEVRKRIDKIEEETLLIDVKELCRMLSISRPTCEKLFIFNPKFPAMRVGKKWLFHRREVEEYIQKWAIDVRKKGGQVECN